MNLSCSETRSTPGRVLGFRRKGLSAYVPRSILPKETTHAGRCRSSMDATPSSAARIRVPFGVPMCSPGNSKEAGVGNVGNIEKSHRSLVALGLAVCRRFSLYFARDESL